MNTKLFRTFFRKGVASTATDDPLALARSEITKLRETVFDLLVEIEAIRATVLSSPLGSGGARSPYAIAYRQTGFRTHDAKGPSSGHEKLMAQFYPREQSDWRECLFMRRLGMSPDDIAKYKREAEEAETYT